VQLCIEVLGVTAEVGYARHISCLALHLRFMRAPIVLNGSLMICMQSDQPESSFDNVAHCHAVSRGGFAWWLVGGEFNPKEVYQTSLRGRGASFAYPQDVYRAASEFVSNDSLLWKELLAC